MSSDRAVRGALRRKITIACEVCRKRKARCSGTVPCALCLKQKLDCHYETSRRKREPRVRVADDESSTSEHTRDISKAQPDSSIVEESVGDFDLSPPTEHPVEPAKPCSPELRQRLRQIYDIPGNIIDDVPRDLIYHLLEVFFTVVNHQQLPLLPPEQGLAWAMEIDRPSFLLASLCLVSVNYSSCEYLSRDRPHPLVNQIASKCRLMLLEAETANHLQDLMISSCALGLHEASNGNGTQAWCDIGLAQNMIPLISALNLSQLSKTIFSTGCDFLVWFRTGFAFGNPPLTASISAYNDIPSDMNDSGPYSQTKIRDATRLLLDSIEYATQETQKSTIPAWQRGSALCKLRLRLDHLSITIAQSFDLDPKAWESSLAARSEMAVETVMSLIRDCCTILLNRAFLPTSPPSAQIQDDDGGPQTLRMFLQGRIHACEASAESIYELCTVLISTQIYILPPFLGYCCFQAALVFMNALGCLAPQSRREELADKLRVIFMVLGALRKAYKPANLWIDALLRINKFLSQSSPGPKQIQSAGQNFFARFNGIQEPPFVTLTDQSLDNEPETSDSPNDSLPRADKLPEEAPKSWVNSYRMHLREQVEALAPIEELQNHAAPNPSAYVPGSPRSPQTLQPPDETADQPCTNWQTTAPADNSIDLADGTMAALHLESPARPSASSNLPPEVPSYFASMGYAMPGLLDDSMQLEGLEILDLNISHYLGLGEAMLDPFGLCMDPLVAQALSTEDRGEWPPVA